MAVSEDRLLLLIDGDPEQAGHLTAIVSRDRWRTVVVRDSETAIAMLGTHQGMRLGAILLDCAVPGDHAIELIGELKRRRPGLPIVMLAQTASPLLAVAAIRAGVADYLVKPVAAQRLLQALHAATSAGPSDTLLADAVKPLPGFEALIGTAPAFRAALANAASAAAGTAPLLIEGEPGTGKAALVRALHAASPRALKPLRIITVAGIPANQIESVVFGHEQDAFPGAFERLIGALLLGDGGTVMIDGIDQMPMAVQAKLAAFIDSGEARPIGARHAERPDVRLILCSTLALADLVTAGRCDAGLYARIAVHRVHLPPLRERGGDIPALSAYFLEQIAKKPGLIALDISDAALEVLAKHDWPDNVRQLQAVLFRAAVYCDDGELTPADFASLADTAASTDDPRETEASSIALFAPDGNLRPLEAIEADVIRLAIGHYRGRMSEVARRLGIGRSTLYRKLSELGIETAA